MKNTGDLHLHSVYSDGTAAVEEIVAMAALKNLDYIAITDHDTLASQDDAALYGEKYGINIIKGVELSGYDYKRNQKAHILCYMPKHPEALDDIFKRIYNERMDATLKMLDKVKALYPITDEMVTRCRGISTVLYKQHIMHALAVGGYTNTVFGEKFTELFNHKHGKAHLEIIYPDVHDILYAIKEAKGVAVMAHPGESKEKGLLEELCKKNLIDGVELYCPKNDNDEIARVKAIGDKYNLLYSAGTDYHGFYANHPNPVGTFTTEEGWIDNLLETADKK